MKSLKFQKKKKKKTLPIQNSTPMKISFLKFYFIYFFYTAGSYKLSILYILVYICQSQPHNSSQHPHATHHHFPTLVSICLFSTSVSQFLPCRLVHLYHISRFHIYAFIYDICFSLSDLLHSV